MEQTKSFEIPKQLVVKAYKMIRGNAGAAGVDGQTLEGFDHGLRNNLYKIWNRMSSGSYMPAAVKRVEIPKKGGGVRPLGIPTVSDRIAQMVARLSLEPLLEPVFHEDSYGYRPKRSAHQALEVTRKRCWKYNWVVDLDIKGFFDAIDHKLLLTAVDHHKPPAWVRLYIERWLKAPAQDNEGNVYVRDKGTPQGGVISPLLANLYLHYAFDMWMCREHPVNPFERYADDIVIHCRSQTEAESLLVKVKGRFEECLLTIHPEKSKIVYCKDQNRNVNYEHTEFDFLSFTFRPRMVRSKTGQYFVGFTPAISKKAEKALRDELRSWKVHKKTDKDVYYLSRAFNPVLRGWIGYYSKFRPSALIPLCRMFQVSLVKWARNKYKGLKRSWKKAFLMVNKIAKDQPTLFAHWEHGWYANG